MLSIPPIFQHSHYPILWLSNSNPPPPPPPPTSLSLLSKLSSLTPWYMTTLHNSHNTFFKHDQHKKHTHCYACTCILPSFNPPIEHYPIYGISHVYDAQLYLCYVFFVLLTLARLHQFIHSLACFYTYFPRHWIILVCSYGCHCNRMGQFQFTKCTNNIMKDILHIHVFLILQDSFPHGSSWILVHSDDTQSDLNDQNCLQWSNNPLHFWRDFSTCVTSDILRFHRMISVEHI